MPAKLTRDDFVLKSTLMHHGKYDYALSVYTNNNAKITINCPEHGPFEQRASNHMIGIGCPRCKAAMTAIRHSDDTQSFVKKAKEVHGDVYDYSATQYARSSQKVEIKCPIHGVFWQKPNAHISSAAGCPKCAGKSMTTTEFIEKAHITHGELYGYGNTEYTLIKEPVTVTCHTHGDFQQSAEGHLAGRGCRQCWAATYSSVGEREIGEFIESLGFAVERNTRTALNNRLEVDVFVPVVNLGIEYNGCYWHSDKVEKNKRKHEFKHAAATTHGVRLLTVWDYDWLHRPAITKRHIAHALGVDHGRRVSARACAVTPITTNEANALYEENHIQGACRGGIAHIGLKHDGELVAAMTFSQGGARRGMSTEGEWELARFATSAVVRGAASRLFAAFIRDKRPATVWSFSDKQHFDGGIYKTLGFTLDAELAADYRIVHPYTLQTWHKSLWQRKSIQKRLSELGSLETFDHKTDPRTEHQMQDAARVLRIWDAGKIRWRWTAST